MFLALFLALVDIRECEELKELQKLWNIRKCALALGSWTELLRDDQREFDG